MYVYKPSTLGYPHDIWKPPYASNDFRGSSTAVFVQVIRAASGKAG